MIGIVGRSIAGIGIAAVLTSCGSSGPGQRSSAPALPPSAPASASESGTPADPATLAAISRAYATFFGSTSTLAQSQASLQHGEKFTKTLAEQAKSSYAGSAGAKVDSATVVSTDVAAVKFTITSGGSTLLSGAPGYAVKTGSTWQVAAQTFCGLLKLQGDAPAACDDPTVTALTD